MFPSRSKINSGTPLAFNDASDPERGVGLGCGSVMCQEGGAVALMRCEGVGGFSVWIVHG